MVCSGHEDSVSPLRTLGYLAHQTELRLEIPLNATCQSSLPYGPPDMDHRGLIQVIATAAHFPHPTFTEDLGVPLGSRTHGLDWAGRKESSDLG